MLVGIWRRCWGIERGCGDIFVLLGISSPRVRAIRFINLELPDMLAFVTKYEESWDEICLQRTLISDVKGERRFQMRQTE